MTRKIYRTAQGKMVDLGALQLQNENVRAVGNMGVNARGDLLDSGNQPIDKRNKQVARQYNRQTVSTTPASSQKQQAEKKVDIPAAPEDFEDDFVKEVALAPASETAVISNGGGGLAAAIAKARQIKQEPMTPPSKSTGVKKF